MECPSTPGPARLFYRLYLAGYVGLLWAAQPLVWRYFRKRGKGDALYAQHLDERRGEGEPFDADVWVHAVSMGEMKSAGPLVNMLLADGLRVVTTHATPTGRRSALSSFGEAIEARQMVVRYAPIDLPGYWRKFFAGTGLKAGLVMEMEFWPCMIEAAAEAGVVLCLANSQVPGKSFPRATRLAGLFGHSVQRVAAVFAKSEPMADRFRSLGAKHVQVMGETRFDITAPMQQLAAGRALGGTLGGRRVLTLASVVAGEEDTYVDALRPLLDREDAPFVIWVPRAPELFSATVELLRSEGFAVAERSEALGDELEHAADLGEAQILVGDSLGEMFFYLAPADAVIVGGGFVPSGAHNVIEPLSLGKPVITGPEVWTIEYPAVEAQAAGILTICNDAADLPKLVLEALSSSADAAEAFHSENVGASMRIYQAIRPLLGDCQG